MEKNFLSSERIYLRAVEPEDLGLLYLMENDPGFWDISNFSVPYSRYMLKQYIENSASDVFADKQLRLMIVRKSDNIVLGSIDVSDFVPLHLRGAIGIALLEKHRRQGYGKEALNLLCEYAFDFLQVKQLYAHVPDDNEASKRLFVSCGFDTCGVMKDWLRTKTGYKDVLMMQLIR